MRFTSFLFNAGTNVAVLILLALGLALIFATRGIINLAHGEFVMLGAYVALRLSERHVPFLVTIGIATLALGLFGLLVERLLIRWLYGRVADCMLATWGLSLILVQAVTLIYGTKTQGLSIPLGTFRIGRYTQSAYSAVLIAVALAALLVVYLIMRRSSFGLRARATAREPAMAEAVGVDTARVDMLAFAIGAATAGLAGAVLAPYLGVSPTMGQNFIAKVFMSVIVGGADFVIGTPVASALLGSTETWLSTYLTPVAGQIGLLAVAIVIIRIRPAGLTRAGARR